MFNFRKSARALLASLALATSPSLAAEPTPATPSKAAAASSATPAALPPPPSDQTSMPKNAIAEEIASINERLALLAAQLAELEMQAKIAAKKAEIGKATGIGLPIPTNTPRLEAPLVGDSYLPTVQAIDGVDGKLRADVYVQGGAIQTVRVGDTIGNWKVKDIQMDSVTVQKGKEIQKLGFGNYTEPKPAASANRTTILPPPPQ